MSLKERQRYRNQIAAQQARIRRKEEQIILNKSNREKDVRFTKLVKLMAANLDQNQLMFFHKELSKQWKIDDSFYSSNNKSPSRKQRLRNDKLSNRDDHQPAAQ